MENAIRSVGGGSNTVHGYTDQGLPTDPNGWRQPQMSRGGNVFTDWNGGVRIGAGGADSAAAYREFLMAGAARGGYAGGTTGNTFGTWMEMNRLGIRARGALSRSADATTTNTSTSSTHIGEMNVTVPPGASADDYAYRIQGVLQRNDPVQQALTGQR